MTNKGVVVLLNLGFSSETVIAKIKTSSCAFDLSGHGIVALAEAGVPEDVILAMLDKSPPTTSQIPPYSVIVLEENTEHILQNQSCGFRSVFRFFLTDIYAEFSGAHAAYTARGGKPRFLVAIPHESELQHYIQLANALCHESSREILVYSGQNAIPNNPDAMIDPDRRIELEARQSPDQSRAPKEFAIFEVTPTRDLPPGEYILLLKATAAPELPAKHLPGNKDLYFDFRVD